MFVFSAQFENDWTTDTDVMGERDCARFEFNVSFGPISSIAQPPGVT